MTNKIFLALAAVMLITSCKKSAQTDLFPETELIPPEELDALIRQQMENKGSFFWNHQSVPVVWSALHHSDNILSVGYRAEGQLLMEGDDISGVDIKDENWRKARESLLEMILAGERELDPEATLENRIPWDETVLPVINIAVYNPATLYRLRDNPLVRYAEPMGYEPRDVRQRALSSSGCGNPPVFNLTANQDYTIVAPSVMQSWNYPYHGIPQAWTRTTGAGVKLFLIDTGVEFDQENLGAAFNQGYSQGRTIERIVTLPRQTFLGIPIGSVETPDDGCGHGTAMAGVCAAPRGRDGAMVGVAYNANLITCRAASDVLLDDSREVKGASDAFTTAGNRADVRIISMSMGRITSSSQLADAIRYAYGRGKLIFCAAGTSFGWTSGWFGVIFPATMPEVNAVTGVRDNNFNTTCTTCHDGSQTDFTIVMERAANSRNPLTLAETGDVPATVGGSSVATATAAGIAALVWSRFPGYSRDQILNKLITTSARYPYKSSTLGWGNLNANLATQ
jgi:hypothetical protein